MTREKWIERLASAADLIRAGVVMDQHIHLSAGEADQIVKLLKEQEAVEPNVAFTRVNGTKAFSCPKCSALIYGGSYCSHCGQALKGGTIKRR